MKRTNRDASEPGFCRAAPAGADTEEGTRDRGDREQRTGAPSARRERVRPLRPEVDRAALDLIRRRGHELLGTARRYAANLDDADDAYQRGLEILLRKAPSTREEDLVPWLKTVVKHEAFALRRHRERHAPVTDDGELPQRGTPADATHDQAGRYELLRQGAEALRELKPQEARALQLRAEGYTYAEICEITGWTYTKVNRALTEGRQALAIKLAGIQGGIECAKLAPQLLAVLDGEASVDEVAQLELHMKTCLSCRARLRSMRAARRATLPVLCREMGADVGPARRAPKTWSAIPPWMPASGEGRHAPTPEDADDAYQRGLEILLRKAPTTRVRRSSCRG